MNEIKAIQQAIDWFEEQRKTVGDTTNIDTALSALRQTLLALQVDSIDANTRQQRKQVTVLFADVSNFTSMAEMMDPEEVSGVIDDLWTRLDKAILDQGGRIDKHIGDAVMALFGAPTAQEDDPERAVRAGLVLQAQLREWKEEFKATMSDQERLAVQKIMMRVGINTGSVLLGKVGTTREYTAIGDTVNLASRIEHAAPLGGVLISHNTYRHIRGIFELMALDPISVKGKSEPVKVYSVRSVKPRSFKVPTRGVEGVETRMIGREAELAQVQSAFETATREKHTYLFSIVAEAGTGKSRLLYEFNNWLETQPYSMRVFKGRASLEMLHVPYSLIRDLLSTSFNIQDSDTATIARHKLEQGISKTLSGEDALKCAHFIGHLMGVDYSTSPYLQGILGDARQIRDLAFHYLSQFFTEVVRDQTAVILLEDLHWADSDSLDFVDYLLHMHPDLPLLVIGMMRPSFFEKRPDWGQEPIHHLRVDLLPLSEQDCRRLVAEILRKVPEIPGALTELVVSRAEGSPFYVEELIKVLIESDVILTSGEEWSIRMDRLANLKVPATLTGLLQARLDSLSANDREILEQAAVVGRVFWTEVVEHMHKAESHTDATDVNDSLGSLRRKELIFSRQQSAFAETPEYIFKHAILHDVAYESVLLRLRRIYHVQAAEGLIWLSGERVNEFAGRIGEHFEKAGDLLQAAEWYTRAGRRAQDAYAPDSAITFYRKALDFFSAQSSEDHIPEKLEICMQLGEVLNWQARYTEAIEIFTQMRQLAEGCFDFVKLSIALVGLATSHGYIGEHKATLKYALESQEAARKSNAKLELAKALWIQGSAHFRLGEAQKTLALAEQALAIATELNDRVEMGRCLNMMAASLYTLGKYRQAESTWEDALTFFEELGNRRQGMDTLSNLGVLADALGDYETAFRRYHSALEIAREVGYRDGEIVFLTNRGGEQVALKNYAAAEADLRKAIELAGTDGSWCMPYTYYYYAEAMLGLGKYEMAYYSARQSLALSMEDRAPENLGAAWRALGMISEKTGDSVYVRQTGLGDPIEYSPQACFTKSAEIFAEAEMQAERARTLREWAKYEFGRHNQEQGIMLWEEARSLFAKVGANMEVERMRELPALD
ncbi:MAG TPA: adenylate/guanylate cyclase domain-containing protein [Anaerolineales bacterium]|nr:adenylate/guanylate cyclase domain-containing protein [Anaerolineales bacterium]